jgi:hypothetical protein
MIKKTVPEDDAIVPLLQSNSSELLFKVLQTEHISGKPKFQTVPVLEAINFPKPI